MATFSYSQDPSTTPKDEVRFLMQDTDASDFAISDEEIAYLLDKYTNPLLTAIAALTISLTRIAEDVNTSKQVGDLKLFNSASNRLKNMQIALAALQAQSNRLSPATPYAGGLTSDDVESNREDDSLVKHDFTLGFSDDVGTGTNDNAAFSKVVPG